MNSDELKNRSKNFAHRCVKLAGKLSGSYLGKHIQKQLIRSSTSVAANYRAACLSQSRATFIAKLSIVIEEVDESAFWIEFSIDENLTDQSKTEDLLNESKELTSIFMRSRLTAKQKKDKSSSTNQ